MKSHLPYFIRRKSQKIWKKQTMFKSHGNFQKLISDKPDQLLL